MRSRHHKRFKPKTRARALYPSTVYMITLLPTLAALGAAFVQPTSPEQFRRYFVGQWTVNKMINYKAGGISGRMLHAARRRVRRGV